MNPKSNFDRWTLDYVAMIGAVLWTAAVLAIAVLGYTIVYGSTHACYDATRITYHAHAARLPHPEPIVRALRVMEGCYGLPVGLMLAIAERENSTLDPDVPDGEAGEAGLMHIKPATVLQVLRLRPANRVRWPETPESLAELRKILKRDVVAAIYWPARYIVELLVPRCGTDRACLAAGYNGGDRVAAYAAAVVRRSAQLAGEERQ